MPELKAHAHPAWRSKANFVLRMKTDVGEADEEVWAEQLPGSRFMVCCIPFFIYDMALGDVLRVSEVDGKQLVQLVETSGHHTFRALLARRPQGDAVDELMARQSHDSGRRRLEKDLRGLGALWEWHGDSLISMDAADDAQAASVVEYLIEQEGLGRLTYETGRTEALAS